MQGEKGKREMWNVAVRSEGEYVDRMKGYAQVFGRVGIWILRNEGDLINGMSSMSYCY